MKIDIRAALVSWIGFIVASLALLAACATPAGQESLRPQAPQASANDARAIPGLAARLRPGADDTLSGAQVVAALRARQEAMQQQYPPRVYRLQDGTEVQPTPSDPGAYNTYFLDADHRGCRSCHADLGEVLRTMPYVHLDMGHMFGIDVTVTHCLGCHTYSPGHLKEPYAFGRLMHALHRPSRGFSGDCVSCHDYTERDGKFQLWEDVRHQALRGIVDLPDARGAFSFDQNVVTANADLFSLNWLYDQNDFLRYASLLSGRELAGDIFDTWTIRLSGDVRTPRVLRLADLIREAPVETVVMKMHCTMNPPGAGLIENVRITGIPLGYVLDQAGGVKPGATAVHPSDSGGYSYPTTLEHLGRHRAYLVFEINGRRLSTIQGYPVQLWVEGMGAQAYVKQLSEIRVSSEPVATMPLYRGWARERGGYFNKPNLGIFRVKDGQIIAAGEPFTFEGYADAFDEAITGVEISMDRCKTWTRYETPGAGADRWLYWRYAFTPKEPGAYVICARATTEKGLVSDKPVTLLVNARRP